MKCPVCNGPTPCNDDMCCKIPGMAVGWGFCRNLQHIISKKRKEFEKKLIGALGWKTWKERRG